MSLEKTGHRFLTFGIGFLLVLGGLQVTAQSTVEQEVAHDTAVALPIKPILDGHLGSEDSGNPIVSPEDFLGQVIAFHPIARQASLLNQMAEANLRGAKGAFDPKLSSGYENKTLNGSEYFDYLETELKVATLPGIDVIGSYNMTEGLYINPERRTPDAGLIEAGASVNLGQGLLIDKRRADLRKARLMINENELSRQLILNDLWADALITYWDWAEAAAKVRIYLDAVDIAQARFEAVRQSYFNGNEPGIDTLEAWIRVERRRIDLANAEVKMQKSRNMALAFLWEEDGSPTTSLNGHEPIPLSGVEFVDQLPEVGDEALAAHPEIQRYQNKLDQAVVDRRWKKEQLKPELAVKWLYQSGVPGSDQYAPSINNQKVNFSFSFPLFLRKERAGVEMANIKIEQLGLARDGKQRTLLAKAQALLAEEDILSTQILRQRQIVADYQSLFAAENTLFTLGESSLFKLQSRETNLIKARLDLAGLLAQYPRVEVDLLRVLGQAYPAE